MSVECPRIGIVGIGMVGTPMKEWFENPIPKPWARRTRGVGLFCFDADPAKGCTDDVNQADIIFVCVPTPPARDGSCDTRIVRSVISGIADGKVVVIKSTVLPGTVEGLQSEFPTLKFLFSPEFLTESRAGEDFRNPSRQIVAPTEQGRPHAARIAHLLPDGQFVWPDAPIYGPLVEAHATEAEVSKYSSNWFGALKVTFSNIVADICYVMSRVSGRACRSEAVLGMTGQDKRIGSSWMNPDYGTYNGYGGSCLPKDTVALRTATVGLLDQFLSQTGPTRSPNDNAIAGLLEKGIRMMDAMTDYNTALLEVQGLTLPDVSQHDHDHRKIVLEKRRPVRI